MTVATFGPQLDLEIPAATMAMKIEYVDRASVFPDPSQPRKEPDAELLESIRTNGMLQPISVRPHPEKMLSWMIIDGERRWRGAEGILEQVPVIVREDLDDRVQRLQTQLVSNVGKPLTPLEEAQAFAELMGQHDSIASLARALGRPERSVGERLQLLEIGPWLAWVADGRLPLSHAVKVLLPLRSCANKVHEHAITLVEKDWRFKRNGKGDSATGISVHDFERLVQLSYRGSMYPLTKTKATYDKQPAFDTSAHERECDCGGIMFELQSTKRKCCGNPGWWRPKARQAQKDAPKKKANTASDRRELRFYLPDEAKRVRLGAYSYEAPKGTVQLTRDSRWKVVDFDPTTLALKPEQLVLVEPKHGNAYVAASAAAVKAAREAWATRWRDRRTGLVEALRRRVTEKSSAYRVTGPGVAELLAALGDDREQDVLFDAAAAQKVALPELEGLRYEAREKAVTKWIGGLSEKDAEAIATTYAYLLGTRTASPSSAVEKEILAERQRLEKKPIPWTKAPKGGVAAKTKTKTKKGKAPPPDDSIDDEDDEDDDEAGE